MERRRFLRILILLLGIVTFVFFCLYHPFLFGGQMYAYSDVGADTIDQYLPVFCYETENIRGGILEAFDLQNGLGKYTGGYLLKYLNPVNLPLLLLGPTHLHIALMISMYMKYVLVCIFGFLFFFRLLKNEEAAILCSLLWTFSGFAVLWGQHYQFLTAIVGFTVMLWGFQLYLEKDRHWYLVIPASALLAATSYYYFYVSCFFFLLYGILYLVFHGQKKEVLKRAGGFAVLMIPAFVMAAEYLLPAVESFFSSSRVNQVSSALHSELFYPLKVLVAYLARFLSNDLFGTGDSFLGPTNYYECAILSVSVLSGYALCYLLLGRHWKRVCIITVGCVAALCLPAVSKILVFSTTAQRWTYLLAMTQVIAIGFAYSEACDDWHQGNGKKKMLTSIILADVLLVIIFVVLYSCHVAVGGWLLNKRACDVLLCTLAMYHLLTIIALCRGKWHYALLLIAVILEMVMANYASVNHRETVSRDDWQNGMYYDGTSEIVRWIQEQDDSLYRINKTYTSVSDCDPLIQGFNGMSIYSSTNSAELINLAYSFGYSEAGNRIHLDGNDLLSNLVMGVKYVIAKSEKPLNSEYFEKIYDDGNFAVFENQYWSGFGSLYPIEAVSKNGKCNTAFERLEKLSKHYYMTDEALDYDSEVIPETMDILPFLENAVNCTTYYDDTMTVTGTGLGMQLIFTVPEIPEGTHIAGIRITMDSEMDSAICLLSSANTEFDEDCYDIVYYGSGNNTCVLDNPLELDTNKIRVDLSWAPQTIMIESLEIILVDRTKVIANLEAKSDYGVVDFAECETGLRGSVENNSHDDAMLCVPLIYSDKWKVTIDGIPAITYNINGGLLGIEIPKGKHDVDLKYNDLSGTIGGIMSAVGIAGYVLAVCILEKRRRNV